MKAMIKLAAAAALFASVILPSAALAQQPASRGIVSLYHAVPGHQEALIKWLAEMIMGAREEAAMVRLRERKAVRDEGE